MTRDDGPEARDAGLIVLQTSDAYQYYDMLMATAETARAFARNVGADYQAFVGLKRGDRNWHATYNRVPLLKELSDRGFRGWVLYLDADAWVQDLSYPLRDYLSDKAQYALIGTPCGDYEAEFWRMNIGVMLYNLGRADTREVIDAWDARLSALDLTGQAINWGQEVLDDQGMLHRILKERPHMRSAVLHESKDFLNSAWARFVRQALRAENLDFDARLQRIRQEVSQVLQTQR